MTDFNLWSNHSDCTGSNGNPKRRYYSESEARNSALYQEETRGIMLRVYHCPDCGFWHLTKRLFYTTF